MDKWSKLFLEHENEIKEKLGEMLKIAYGRLSGIISLILDEEGKLYIEISESESTINEDINSGKAVYVETFDAQYFEISDDLYTMNIDNAERIFTECGGGEYYEKYIKNLGEEERFDAREIYDSLPVEIRKKVFEKIVQNNIEYFFEKFYPELRDYWTSDEVDEEEEDDGITEEKIEWNTDKIKKERKKEEEEEEEEEIEMEVIHITKKGDNDNVEKD